jgi:hypothetical protein
MKKEQRTSTMDELWLIQQHQLTKTAIEQSAMKRAAYMTKISWNYCTISTLGSQGVTCDTCEHYQVKFTGGKLE